MATLWTSGMQVCRALPRLCAIPTIQRGRTVRLMSTETDALQIDVDSKTGVATMKMCRPPVNSLNLEYLTSMNIALEKLENEKCKGLILTSAVPKIFCAGLDILEMYQPDVERLQVFWRSLQDVWLRLYGSKMATIAAINGHSPAGGCLLATCCDYRIMAPNYTIGLNETQLGIVAPFWFKDTMYGVIGNRETEYALTLGVMYSTEEALGIKLIDKVVPQDEVYTAAQEKMKQYLKIPEVARQLSKDMMRRETVEKLRLKREEDVANFKNFAIRDSVQKSLGMYLEMLKKKSQQKK
ncbi:enoyl-CoA delta isomerase 1, mitochondrial-like [Ylistrum balloti]|uniref:enoyl-CoA delta isomerase 1, mitochondrial-like n=1 Tax=Ylistrum balloti TaxID=509963 RepID=UPI002905BAD0|nr:enoyl-CoA delta isomerase 1, mitochondrial-like [Ylistrum balloti]